MDADEARRLLDRATPGPWVCPSDKVGVAVVYPDGRNWLICTPSAHNAALIAAAPDLAQTVIDQAAEIERSRPSALDVHRLARAAWSLCVEEQAANSPAWSMAKRWAFDDLREAVRPFLTEDEHGASVVADMRTAAGRGRLGAPVRGGV